MKIDGFDWDASNAFKNETKHGLSRESIEPSGRPMIVAFTFRIKSGLKLIRTISARYMHAKEAKKYEQAFTKDEK